jgi:Domain of unknown function (DUF4145)
VPQVIEPAWNAGRFTCPRCGTVAEQQWCLLTAHNQAKGVNVPLDAYRWCVCVACGDPTLWQSERPAIVWPVEGGPPAHQDMPEEAARLYNEARAVLGASPQAAAALLRVATEAIVDHLLGRSDVMLDRGIEELVSRDLIRTNVKQACDVLRVTGNQMLHPGQIDAADANAEIAARLFLLVNLIVEQAITEPALVAGLHASLPDTKLSAIETRDRRAAAARSN